MKLHGVIKHDGGMNKMSVGLGIFLGLSVCGVIFLYTQTKNSWSWGGFSGKQRLKFITATCWLLFWLFISKALECNPSRYNRNGCHNEWYLFLFVGVAPIAIILAIAWVRRGYKAGAELEKALNKHYEDIYEKNKLKEGERVKESANKYF